MSIKEQDIKLLWASSCGRCNNPSCKIQLIDIVKQTTLGEMAHIIAKNPDGPRGNTNQKNDNTYNNLLLLCPTCHTKIDKSPTAYPIELLQEWKQIVEQEYNESINIKFNNLEELKIHIEQLLIENELCFKNFGPKSETALKNPNSNLGKIWQLRKLETIIPNNKKIINIIENNLSLIDRKGKRLFLQFKEHAHAFEKNQYTPLDSYPLFPLEFQEYFLS